MSEETQERIKNQSSLFLGKSCNYVTNPLEEVSRTDYAFLLEGGRATSAGAGENEAARSQIMLMRDTTSLTSVKYFDIWYIYSIQHTHQESFRILDGQSLSRIVQAHELCKSIIGSREYEVLFQKQPLMCNAIQISSWSLLSTCSGHSFQQAVPPLSFANSPPPTFNESANAR